MMMGLQEIKEQNDQAVREHIKKLHADIAQAEIELVKQGWLDDTKTVRNLKSELAVLQALAVRKPISN